MRHMKRNILNFKVDKDVATAIDDLATMPTGKTRFRWGRASKVPKNTRRTVRRIFNRLNLQQVLENAYRDLIVYGIPLNREN